MRKLYAFTLTAMLTLVAMAPSIASAAPVPPDEVLPPDAVPAEECTTDSGVCPPTYTVPVTIVGPGGSIPGTATCSLLSEITVTSEMTITIGHITIHVTSGTTVCNYGFCGVVTYQYGSIGVSVGGPN